MIIMLVPRMAAIKHGDLLMNLFLAMTHLTVPQTLVIVLLVVFISLLFVMIITYVLLILASQKILKDVFSLILAQVEMIATNVLPTFVILYADVNIILSAAMLMPVPLTLVMLQSVVKEKRKFAMITMLARGIFVTLMMDVLSFL
jgi:signal transduction histidine kinase